MKQKQNVNQLLNFKQSNQIKFYSYHMTSSSKTRSDDRSGSKQPPSAAVYSQSRSKLFLFIYKNFKYGVFVGVILFIVLSGIFILGDTSEPIANDRQIFGLYKESQNFNSDVQQLNKLLNKENSKFISNKAINLFLQENVHDDVDIEHLNTQFDNLMHFTEYFVSQNYQNARVLKLPLTFYDQKISNIIPSTLSSRWLKNIKNRLLKFLQKNGIQQNQSVKDFKWSRVKKLIEGSKIEQIWSLLKYNVINYVWQWIKSQPQVIILTVDDSQINQQAVANKKLLNKWIRQNEDSSQIIILSRYSINQLYDVEQEDHFKSYQMETGIQQFQKDSFCKYLQKISYNEDQCQILRTRFDSVYQLQQFIQDQKQQYQNDLLTQKYEQHDQVLKKICEKGHTIYYFYQNQQNANKVLTRNKKVKKSRLDRQLEALIVKWSQAKKALGLSKLKDVYLTLFSNNEKNQMSLQQANSIGLVYDFDLHELKWRNEEQRIEYQIKMGKNCKGSKIAEQEMKDEEQQQKEQQKQRQEQAKNQEQNDTVDENENEDQDVEVEYEQNWIKFNKDQKNIQQTSQTEDQRHTVDKEVQNEQIEQQDVIQQENEQQQIEQGNDQQAVEGEEQGEEEEQNSDNEENGVTNQQQEEQESDNQVEQENQNEQEQMNNQKQVDAQEQQNQEQEENTQQSEQQVEQQNQADEQQVVQSQQVQQETKEQQAEQTQQQVDQTQQQADDDEDEVVQQENTQNQQQAILQNQQQQEENQNQQEENDQQVVEQQVSENEQQGNEVKTDADQQQQISNSASQTQSQTNSQQANTQQQENVQQQTNTQQQTINNQQQHVQQQQTIIQNEDTQIDQTTNQSSQQNQSQTTDEAQLQNPEEKQQAKQQTSDSTQQRPQPNQSLNNQL